MTHFKHFDEFGEDMYDSRDLRGKSCFCT